jgi:hypothetical protein
MEQLSDAVYNALNQYDDAHFIREYGQTAKNARQAVSEMEEGEKDAWIEQTMALLSKIMLGEV